MLNRIAVFLALMTVMNGAGLQAQEPPNFDFLGHVPSVPTVTGNTLEMFSVLTNKAVVPTPVPLVWTGHEHTLILRVNLAGSAAFSQFYSTGTVEIWTDVGPSTPHDFANTATFGDGTLVLSGVVTGTLTRNKYTPTLGSFVGTIDWTGGARIAELGGNSTGWPIGGGIGASNLPAGYAETWDGVSNQP